MFENLKGFSDGRVLFLVEVTQSSGNESYGWPYATFPKIPLIPARYLKQ